MKAAMLALAGATAVSTTLAAGTLAASAAPATSAVPGLSAALASNVAMARALQPGLVLREGTTVMRVTVRSLQYLLNARGAKLMVDGVFGPRMKAAVITFQRSHGLVASGVVDTATWRALIVTVWLGSVGPGVGAVQDQINFRNLNNGRTLVVDGIFGPKTATAVRAFQHAMSVEIPGFAVDGIVGPQTWQALVTEALSG